MYWNRETFFLKKAVYRLTLTWDVLKSLRGTLSRGQTVRLTLTWDVLKYALWQAKNKKKEWLTLTWDVLK